MKKSAFTVRGLMLALLVATLPALVTCEVENPRALFVYDAMALTARQQCIIQPGQRAQAILPFGIMDVMITNNYYLFPRFRNMMLSSLSITGEGATSLQTETNYLHISGAKVWIDLGEFNNILTEEQLYVFGTEGIQHTVSAGVEPEAEGAVAVEVIKAELGNLIAERMRQVADSNYGLDINVYVMLMAENQAGEIIYSNEFAFPIKVCYNCLVRVSASDTVTEMPCFPGQDYAIPSLMCPAIALYPEDCPDY